MLSAFLLVLASTPQRAGALANPLGPFAFTANGNESTVTPIDLGLREALPKITVGSNPNSVAVNAAGTRAYVTNQGDPGNPGTETGSNTVSVLDISDPEDLHEVVKIPVQTYPIGLAVNRAGTRVYVANLEGGPDTRGSLSVINTASNTVIATIPLGSDVSGTITQDPVAVAVNPQGTRVYVTMTINPGLVNEDGLVKIIDAGANTAIGTVDVGRQPSGLAINRAGTKLYVANRGDPFDAGADSVSVITLSNNSVQDVAVGDKPTAVAVSPSGARVYVANSGDFANNANDTVTVINATNNQVLGGPITVGDNPVGIAVTPAGEQVLVNNFKSDSMSVIDTGTNTVVKTYASVGDGPRSLGQFALPWAKGPFAYVSSYGETPPDQLNVFDTATNNLLAVLELPNAYQTPQEPVFNGKGTRLYLPAGDNPGKVVEIDPTDQHVIRDFTVGPEPAGLAVNSAGTRAYTTSFANGSLSIINLTTGAVNTLSSAALNDPQEVALNPAGTIIYISDKGGPNDARLNVFNAATGANITRINLNLDGLGATRLAVNPRQPRVYVGNLFAGPKHIAVVDTNTNQQIGSINLGASSSGAFDLHVNPAGTRLYASEFFQRRVAVINTASNAVLSTINVGNNANPSGLNTNKSGSRLYIVLASDSEFNSPDAVAVVNTANHQIIDKVSTEFGPKFVGLIPPAPFRCQGKVVTRFGTPASETINGGSGKDVIAGNAGNDTINGGGGNDFLCGEAGNDALNGDGGTDTCDGGAGTDSGTCENKFSIP